MMKINEAQTCFFENINKIDYYLMELIKKREKKQIAYMRNRRGNITTDSSESAKD